MMNSTDWYMQLDKPSWAPPSWVFGPVWTLLYIVIFISFGKVFLMFFKSQIPWQIMLPFALNIIFNLAFTPLQFGLRSNILACIDIFLVLGTLIWALIAIYQFAPWISYVNIPYLVWVLFATILQTSITYLNLE